MHKANCTDKTAKTRRRNYEKNFIVFNLTATAETITVDDKIDYLISHGMPEDFLENKDASAIDDI